MSSLSVDNFQSLSGGTPSTVPPGALDSSNKLATTGWTQGEIATALAEFNDSVNNLLTQDDVSLKGNMWVVNPTTPPVSLERGQKARVSFHRKGFASAYPLPFSALNDSTYYYPDALINSSYWQLGPNLVADGALVEGSTSGAAARAYNANGNPVNSYLISQHIPLSANTEFLVSIRVRFTGGIFPSSGSALKLTYHDGVSTVTVTVPISDIPATGVWKDVFLRVLNVNVYNTQVRLIADLDSVCQFAVEKFRLVSLTSPTSYAPAPLLKFGSFDFFPLVYTDPNSGEKHSFSPSEGQVVDLVYDGLDWVVDSTSSGAYGASSYYRVVSSLGNGSTGANHILNSADLGRTVVFTSALGSVTLPACSSLLSPGTIRIRNDALTYQTVSVKSGSGDVLTWNGDPSDTTTVRVPPRSTVLVTLVPAVPGVPGRIFVEGCAPSNTNSSVLWGHTHSPSGFQRLPSGLILQWGTSNLPTGLNDVVNFPIAFTTACYQVVGTTDSLNCILFAANSFTLSGFTGFTRQNESPYAHVPATVHWFAIGK